MFTAMMDTQAWGRKTANFSTETEAVAFVAFHWRYAADHGSAMRLTHARVTRPDGSIAYWRQV